MSASSRRDGFVPPTYPFDRLSGLAERARLVPGGLVDLSVGTPCDPPPQCVLEALASSGTERGYPSSAGGAALLDAAASYLARRFGAEVGRHQVAACIGTKELVAGIPHWLSLRSPERDTVLYPEISYPTYAMGAQLGGCRAVAVPHRPGGGLDLDAVAAKDAQRALCVWVNSPANPTGELSDLAEVATWGRAHAVPVLSDECYAEFTWSGRPRSILEHGSDGVVAVHSLSKRSNGAGLRAGFYAGDAELVRYLAELRQHAGFMVPGPVQAAATAALGDDVHVEIQRSRYRRRLEALASALSGCGIPAAVPQGSFYLWVRAPGAGESPDWELTVALAERAGVLVTPGDFYGPAGAGFVRIAAVRPDPAIELVVERLAAGALGTEPSAPGMQA